MRNVAVGAIHDDSSTTTCSQTFSVGTTGPVLPLLKMALSTQAIGRIEADDLVPAQSKRLQVLVVVARLAAAGCRMCSLDVGVRPTLTRIGIADGLQRLVMTPSTGELTDAMAALGDLEGELSLGDRQSGNGSALYASQRP